MQGALEINLFQLSVVILVEIVVDKKEKKQKNRLRAGPEKHLEAQGVGSTISNIRKGDGQHHLVGCVPQIITVGAHEVTVELHSLLR